MKKLIATVLSFFVLAGMALSYGQAKITTRKIRLSDFPTKTTKVVLAGNEILNTALREEVSRRWMASPYEFCTLEEYEANKEKGLEENAAREKEAEERIIKGFLK